MLTLKSASEIPEKDIEKIVIGLIKFYQYQKSIHGLNDIDNKISVALEMSATTLGIISDQMSIEESTTIIKTFVYRLDHKAKIMGLSSWITFVYEPSLKAITKDI